METSRVMVVDDSRFMRKIITDIIEADAQFSVVATAENGIEALGLIQSIKPDIITLDLEMPELNGIDTLQAILKKNKIPIIMLSGISESNTRDTIRALQYGAFDFIRKPTSVGGNAHDIVSTGELLIEKMKIAVLTKRRKSFYQPVIDPIKEAKHQILSPNKKMEPRTENKPNLAPPDIKVNSQIINRTKRNQSANVEQPNVLLEYNSKKIIKPNVINKETIANVKKDSNTINFSHDNIKIKELSDARVSQIVAIGTSTGGPRALHEVISNIPAGISAPIVVVQHMPPKFTNSLAQRLDHFSQLSVVEAQDNMELRNGQVYIAPGGYHMMVVKRGLQLIISLTTDPPKNGHRPSVDVLYESLLELKDLERHIVIMTGMGSDGAQGMKSLYEQGVSSTIAESEQTCVVYGMPRSAVELGVVEKVLPLTEIAPEIVRKVMKKALI